MNTLVVHTMQLNMYQGWRKMISFGGGGALTMGIKFWRGTCPQCPGASSAFAYGIYSCMPLCICGN